MSSTRYAIRFNPAFAFLSSVLLMPPRDAFVAVDDEEVQLRMGWAFRTRFPRNAVTKAFLGSNGPPLGIGVHGLRGRYVINGSFDGMVTIQLTSPQRASMAGIPVKAHELTVSVHDPEGLVAHLQPAPTAPATTDSA